MIKQLWFVRNTSRLVKGLNVAVALFDIFYSLLCVVALSEGMTGETAFRQYLWLLFIPVIHLIISFMPIIMERFQLGSFRGTKIIPDLSDTNSPDGIVEKARAYALNTSIHSAAFLEALAIFFAQLDRLNTTKGLKGFGIFPSFLFLAGGIIFYIITRKKYSKKQK